MKKLLALVLALVMCMSLVTISNADFNDADEIDFSEAVEVMNAVGVLAGYENGDFGPNDTLTRAQACKILAYLDLGKDVAEALPSIQVFSDVPASNWAAKYVAYCADAGYVSGIGDGKFDPNANVTGYQFGKMLLCVLGYDATIEGMTGASWQIAVAKLMEENDIADGVAKLGSLALTREDAAQYALNALKATCVEYEDKGTVIEGNGLTITTGAKKAEEVSKNHEGTNCAYCSIAVEPDPTKDLVQLGEKLYKGDLELEDTDEIDEYGRPSVSWKYDGKDIGTYAKTADKTYVGKVAANTLLKDYDLDDGETITVYQINPDTGVLSVIFSDEVEDKYDDTTVAPRGSVTEVFTDGNDIDLIINVPYYVGEVTDVTEADEDDEDDKRTITITYNSTDYTYETESFDEDDMVVFTLGYDADEAEYVVMNVTLAESFTGKISAVKDGKITVNGTKYNKSNYYDGDSLNATTNANVGDEGTFYLTVDGTIGYYTEKSSSTGDFIYIYNIVADKDAADEDGKKDGIYTAYYVDAAGVKASAKLAIGENEAGEDTLLGSEIKIPSDSDALATYLNGLCGMYEYELTDDGLEAVDNSDIENAASGKLDTVKFAAGEYADAKTVFVFVYNKDAAAGTALSVSTGSEKVTSKVVTGIKNVEEYETAKSFAYVTDDGTVTYAFVPYAPADAETDATYGVLLSTKAEVTKSDDGKTSYYTYEVMIDGVKTTLTAKNSSTKFSAKSIAKGMAFEYTLSDGYLSTVKTLSEDPTYVTTDSVAKVVGDDVDMGAAGIYTLADDAVVYVSKTLKNDDLKVTLGSVKKNDKIYGVLNDDDELKFVVVYTDLA